MLGISEMPARGGAGRTGCAGRPGLRPHLRTAGPAGVFFIRESSTEPGRVAAVGCPGSARLPLQCEGPNCAGIVRAPCALRLSGCARLACRNETRPGWQSWRSPWSVECQACGRRRSVRHSLAGSRRPAGLPGNNADDLISGSARLRLNFPGSLKSASCVASSACAGCRAGRISGPPPAQGSGRKQHAAALLRFRQPSGPAATTAVCSQIRQLRQFLVAAGGRGRGALRASASPARPALSALLRRYRSSRRSQRPRQIRARSGITPLAKSVAENG